MKALRFFLAFVPLALAAEWWLHSPALVFVFACLGLLPLAGAMGEATEQLAHRTGERVGGLLNATLGNVAELIITIVALRAGRVELVKASIVGSATCRSSPSRRTRSSTGSPSASPRS